MGVSCAAHCGHIDVGVSGVLHIVGILLRICVVRTLNFSVFEELKYKKVYRAYIIYAMTKVEYNRAFYGHHHTILRTPSHGHHHTDSVTLAQ